MTGGGDQPQEKWEEKLSLEPDFIDDVDQYLTTHKIENVDVLIERLQQKLQMYTMAENRALTRRQKQMERQAHLDKSVACVRMLLDKQESKEDAIVDYSLGGAKQLLLCSSTTNNSEHAFSQSPSQVCCSQRFRSSPCPLC